MSTVQSHTRILSLLFAIVLVVSSTFVGFAVIAPSAMADHVEPEGPYYGDGNRPPHCTTQHDIVSVGNGLTAPRFLDDCYHMRTDLNNLDSATIDVLIAPPISPYPERDLRVMRQSLEMWEAGIEYLARDMGLDWLADGVDFNIFLGHPDDEQSTEPLWFPKIVVVSTNPVGGAGIGIDPLDFIFGASGPCHGVPNPLASFSMWEQLPGFDNHHGGISGSWETECTEGGSLCFAVNGAIDPLPGFNPIFDHFDLVSHEVGHCLSVGHVGDALDHRALAVPRADIMSYTAQPHRKCVSTLDVEAFALRMSEFLLPTPLTANHATGAPSGTFQIQHRDEHRYASETGLATDCPQPDTGILPGPRVDFSPSSDDDPDPDDPVVRIVSPQNGSSVDAGIVPVSGDVNRAAPPALAANLEGPAQVTRGAAARYVVSATGGEAESGYTCTFTAGGDHTMEPVAGTDGCSVDITWNADGTFAVTGDVDDGIDTASDSINVEVTSAQGLPEPNGEIAGGITIFQVGSPLAYNEVLVIATSEAGDPAPKFAPGTEVELNTRFTLDSTGVAGPTGANQPAQVGLPFTWHIWRADGTLVDTVGCTTTQDGSTTTPQNGFNCIGAYTIPSTLGRYFTTLQFDNDGRWSCHTGGALIGVVPPDGVPPCLKAFDVLVRDNVLPEDGGLQATLSGPETVAKDEAARYTLTASGGDAAGGYTCDISASGTHTLTPVSGTNGCQVDISWSASGPRTVSGTADDGVETASDTLDVTVSDGAGLAEPDGTVRGGITIFPTGFPFAYNEALTFGTKEVGDPAPKFLPGTQVELNTRFTKDELGVVGPSQSGEQATGGIPFTWHIWKADGTLVDTVGCATVPDNNLGTPDGFNCIAAYTMPSDLGRHFTTLQGPDLRWVCHSSPPIVGAVPPQGIPECLKAFDILTQEEVMAAEGYGVAHDGMATVPLVLGDTAAPRLANDAADLEVRMALEGFADPMPTVSGSPVSYQVDFKLTHSYSGPPDSGLLYRLTFDWDAMLGDLFNLYVLSAPDAGDVRTLCPVDADLSGSVFNEDDWEVHWVVPLSAFRHNNNPARQAGGGECAAFTQGTRALSPCDTVTDIVGTVSTKAVLFSIGGLGQTNPAPDYTVTCDPVDALEADAGGPYFGVPGASIPLQGQAQGGDGTATCAWSTPDDGVFSAPGSCNTTVTFGSSGTKTVTLTATDGTGSATDSATVSVVDEVAGERVELRVNGALHDVVPVSTGSEQLEADFGGNVDLSGHTGPVTITAEWYDEDGTLLASDQVTVTVDSIVEAFIEIDAPAAGEEVPTDFTASGRGGLQSSTQTAGFLGADGEVDTSHFAFTATSDPAFADIEAALSAEPGFAMLTPAIDDSKTLYAFFEDEPPAELPIHLLPEGWGILALTHDTENAIPLMRDPATLEGPLSELARFPVPEAPEGIGPGSLVANGICTANWVWKTDTTPPRFFLGTAGHCVIASGAQGTGGAWNVCWTGCATSLLGGQWVSLTPIYAINQGIGWDFAIAEIPAQHWDKIRPDMWYWSGPAQEGQPGFPELSVQYGYGMGTGDTFLTSGRPGMYTNGQPWWNSNGEVNWLGATSFGDSGSAVGTGIVDADGIIRGHRATGVVTHLCAGAAGGVPFVNCGTNVDKSRQLAKGFTGLDIQVMLEGEVPPPTQPLNVQATAGDGEVSLTWNPPSFGSPSSYTVRWGTTSGEYTAANTVTGTATTVTGLTNGVTHFFVVSGLNAGGEGQRSAEVQATPQGASPLPSAPRDLQATALDGGVQLSWNEPLEGAPITSYTVYWGTDPDDLGATVSVTGTTATISPLPNGVQHFFRVTASNTEGEGPASGIIDATPAAVPSAPLSLIAEAGDGQVALQWEPPASDGGTAIEEYTVKWGTDAGGPYTGSMTVTPTTALVTELTNGATYFFVVSATNAAGEGPDSDEVSGTPEADEREFQVEVRLLVDAAVVFDWTEADEYDGAQWAHAVSGAPTGSGQFQARLMKDGEPAASDTVEFQVIEVNAPPVLDPIGDRSVEAGGDLAFTVSASDDDGDALTLGAAPLPAGATFADHGDGTGTFSWSPTDADVGEHFVTFTASDGEDEDSEVVKVTVFDLNRPPVLDPIGAKNVLEGELLEFPVSASDPDGDALTLGATPLPAGAGFIDNGDGTGTFSWTPAAGSEGDHEVTFSVTDGEFSDSEPVIITVVRPNDAPIIDPVMDVSVNEGEVLAFPVTASDPDGDVLTLSATDLPAGASFVDNGDGTGAFSWTPGFDQAGDHVVTFTASDGMLNAMTSATITVVDVNRPPVLDSLTDRLVDEQTALTFGVSASDPDGDALVLTAQGLPSGASFTDDGDGTGTFAWTPSAADVGTHIVTFAASDGAASDEQPVTITVEAVFPLVPVLQLTPVLAGIGEPVLIDASGSHQTGRDIVRLTVWTGDGAPPKTASGPAAAVFTHTYTKPGAYLVQLEVENERGDLNTTSAEVKVGGVQILRTSDWFASIQTAVDQAMPDDVVLVHAGGFVENVVVDKPGVEIRSLSPHQARIQPGTGSAVTVAADNVTLTGLRIQQGAGAAVRVTDVAGGTLEITDVLFLGNGAEGSGIAIDASDARTGLQLLVHHNEFRFYGTGLLVGMLDATLVEDNLFDTVGNGIVLGTGASNAQVAGNEVRRPSGTGIDLGDGTGHEVSDNTVLLGSGTGMRVGGMGVVVRGNLLADNGIGMRLEPSLMAPHAIEENQIRNNGLGVHGHAMLGETATLRHNAIFGNTVGAQGPSFVDARFNWWGHPGGPLFGNAVQGGVQFAPWCVQPSCPVIAEPPIPLP